MKFFALAATTVGLAAGAAHAGSIQRDSDRSQILYEPGKHYLEFSVTNVTPDVSGVGTNTVFPLGGLQSGNIQEQYQSYSIGYKGEINERLTFAFVANNPVGADVRYPVAVYPFAGSVAEIESLAATGYLKYQMNDNLSVFGGLRVQSLKGNVRLLSLLGAYTLAVDKDFQLGYVLGGAYEVPEIALRVGATYESKIEHDFVDNFGVPFKVEVPQAVTLHARSGIAKDTVLFGSARWQEWSQFSVAPADFLASPANPARLPIAFGTGDYWTYEIGVGRRFSDNWSGAFTLGYEPDVGLPVGNLEGRDGFMSYGLAAKYSAETYDVTMGVKYFDLGSATTTSIGSVFSGNDALAVGVKVGIRLN